MRPYIKTGPTQKMGTSARCFCATVGSLRRFVLLAAGPEIGVSGVPDSRQIPVLIKGG
jgi:hypothetical protein